MSAFLDNFFTKRIERRNLCGMPYGELSAILVCIGVIPYLISIFRGSVRPERTSWFIWTVILVIGTWSLWASGAGSVVWLLVGELIATAAVFLCSLWRGVGGWERRDLVCLIIAAAGVGMWQLFANSWLGVVGAILADIVALIPTLAKSLDDPQSEGWSTYAFSALASCFGFLAVGTWNLFEMAYPVYLFIANFTTALTIAVSQYQWKRMLKLIGIFASWLSEPLPRTRADISIGGKKIV